MPPSLLLPLVAAALLFSSAIQGASPRSTCKGNANWPGWSGIKHSFVFGDSYTTTGFNETGVQPTATNPLGNPGYPGYTSANGPNWVDFLTVKYNNSGLLTYNLAYGGATIASSLVRPYKPEVSSVSNQIENQFFPVYGGNPSIAPWSSKDSLFSIFDGINDVGNSFGQGVSGSRVLNAKIFSVYHGLVDMLYYGGARNFLFINVPPTDRSPLIIGQGAASQALLKADIKAWNNAITEMVKALKQEKPDVNIFTVDANKYFSQVLDKPASYKQTAGYKNTTAYCHAYANGTLALDTFDASCGVPVNQYFWLNSLHPTYPMQDVLAQQVGFQLEAGPTIC